MLKLFLIIIYSFKFYKISIFFLKLKKCELKNLIKSIQKPIKKSYLNAMFTSYSGAFILSQVCDMNFCLILKKFQFKHCRFWCFF